MMLGPAGSIELATGTARSALARYFPDWNGTRPPGLLADWIAARATSPMTVAGEDSVLTIRRHAPQANSGSHVLVLRERRQSALTTREQEVLTVLAAGLPNKSIARRLGVSIPTVKTHTSVIYRKLKVRSRTEAVAKAAGSGLLDLREVAGDGRPAATFHAGDAVETGYRG